MHHLTLTQEPDRVAYFRVFYESEDILIGSSGFLFGRHIFMQIRDRIALGLEVGGGPGGAPCGLGPECKGVVHIVFVESGFFQFLRRQVSGQLVNDCADDLHMCQFFRAQRSSGNVPLIVFSDGHETVGFPIHSFSTFERIKKYDENEDAGNVGKPYSIEVRDTERTITIYGIASTRFDIAG